MITRRNFLQASLAASPLAVFPSIVSGSQPGDKIAPFKISLAEWSLHRTLRKKNAEYTNLDFPALAKKEFGISAVEYVNQFFADKAKDTKYLDELKLRCDDWGVTSVLVMIDGEGEMGAPDLAARKKCVENHKKWVDAAKHLGCHAIRVNAASRGSYSDQIGFAADGLTLLSEYAAKSGMNVLVENHGGLSSNAAWLAVVMERVGRENCGTLPDFGNFRISDDEEFDRYQGVQALMPYAKAVSAKTHRFDAEGNEEFTDYRRMMKIVTDAGYQGYVGIEWEGATPDEFEGIRRSKALLDRVAEEMTT